MISSPKRPWFRFHLLTAVLMMIAAGGALSISSHRRYVFVANGDVCEFGKESCGWPATAFEQDVVVLRPEWIGKSPEEFKNCMDASKQSHPNQPTAHYIENVGIALPLGASKNEFILSLGETVPIPKATSNQFEGHWKVGSIFVDAAFAMVTILILAAGFEFIVRRREARKPCHDALFQVPEGGGCVMVARNGKEEQTAEEE